MSLFKLHKPDHGKWTRIITGSGIGLLTAWGVYWLLEELRITGASELVLGGVALVILVSVGIFAWWILNKPKIVDFMSATEGEMRKVNWPSKKEIWGSTGVVIAGTLFIVSLLFIIDFSFAALFTWIDILQVDL